MLRLVIALIIVVICRMLFKVIAVQSKDSMFIGLANDFTIQHHVGNSNFTFSSRC